jgi:N-acyl-D-amino-acid deacylase
MKRCCLSLLPFLAGPQRVIMLLSVILIPYCLFSQTRSAIHKLDSGLTYLNQTHRFNGKVLVADNGMVYKKSFGITSLITYGQNIFNDNNTFIPKGFLITNVNIVDGTGSPAFKGAVRIVGNKIKDIGSLKPYAGEEVINGMGKTLAPGFIDSHSHLDGSLSKKPEAIAALNQGITTIIVGQDGSSNAVDSIKATLKIKPVAVNLATYTGHTTLRAKIMGEKNLSRPAIQNELDSMKILLDGEMQKGSLGLSGGLEYERAFFSSRDEVLQLAKETAKYGGRFISHIRSEDVAQDDALDEIENIAKEAKLPVQVSHIKTALKDNWGNAPLILYHFQEVRQAGVDITADCYPYAYWMSTVKVLFPKKDYTNLQSAQYSVEHLFDPALSTMVKFAPDTIYKGKTVAEIAALRKETAAETLVYLVAASDGFEKKFPDYKEGIEQITGASMNEDDVTTFLTWANTNFCTDGGDGGHPRSYGSFTRILGRYVRERKALTLEQAIYKMTGLAAEHTGIKNRGTIAPGKYADLVLFDPQTVIDKATIQNPTALSEGIIKVWVNGECVYQDQQSTKHYPGVFISR